MKYAIVESGGKQYRAVEGSTLDVDRLPVEAGEKIDLIVLLTADGDDVQVGTPTLGIPVKALVLAHVKGPKVLSFKYRPKKRIRVRGGHRHQYTRLMVETIGGVVAESKAAAPKAEKSVDDLTKIEGIGPKVAKTLKEAGITSFADLAGVKAADVQKILNDASLQMMKPEGWIEQAKLAAEGDWDALAKMQAEQKGGRKVSAAESGDKK